MKKKLTRKALIAWARDLYRDDGEFEYWYDLTGASSFEPYGHECGCAVGELMKDFGVGCGTAPYEPTDAFNNELKRVFGTYWVYIARVNDAAPDGPARAKAVQAFMLKQLGVSHDR